MAVESTNVLDPQIVATKQHVAFVSPLESVGEIEAGALRALEKNGHQVTTHLGEVGPDYEDADVGFQIGPMHSNVQIDRSLPDIPFRVWNTEQTPRNIPRTVVPYAAKARFELDTLLSNTDVPIPGGRLRMLGEMLYLRDNITDLNISTYAQINEEFFRSLGLDANTVPPGYFPELGYNQGTAIGDRQQEVVFLGSTNNRRGKILHNQREALQSRKINLAIHDGGNIGEEAIFGHERTDLLNNSKIMLGIGRDGGDDHVFRLCLAGANGIAVVTEHADTRLTYPFVEGEDFIAASLDEMPDVLQQLLADPDHMQRLADSLHKKVLSMPIEDQVSQVIR